MRWSLPKFLQRSRKDTPTPEAPPLSAHPEPIEGPTPAPAAPRVLLLRSRSEDDGTFGHLFVSGEQVAHTVEPPWRGNRPNRSCIPAGVYRCAWHKSPRYGWVYLVTGVDGRTYILTHSGNFGGDVELEKKTHTLGCILLGIYLGWLEGQRAVLSSRRAVREFFDRMGGQPFDLEIREAAHA